MTHLWDQLSEPVKATIDVTSLGVLLLSIANYLPAVAALLTVIWGVLRIYNQWLDIKRKKEMKNGNQ